MHTQSLGQMISRLYRKNQIYLNACLKPYGLTSTGVIILHVLYHHPDYSQDQIARHMDMDKAMITRSLRTLEEAGYLTIQKSQTNRRFNTVTLTQKARDRRNTFESIRDGWSRFLTENMSDEERQRMHELLAYMCVRLDDDNWLKEAKDYGEA